MAKLTKDQVERWNSKLQNGFQFDIYHFMNWGEKQIVKKIPLEDDKILEAQILYRRVLGADRFSDTGKVEPVLHLQVWEPGGTEGMMCSHGTGVYVQVGDEQDKRKYGELEKLSANFTTEKIMECANKSVHF